jgi:hypothetical protein
VCLSEVFKRLILDLIIMKKGFIFILLLFVSSAFAQTQPPKASLIQGEVTAIREADNVIGMKTETGDLTVIISSKTVYKKLLPENPSPVAAVASSLSEIGIGDKIVISAFLSDDKTKATARTVYLMTKADISKKDQSNIEKWKTKSITGKVVLVNEPAKEITVAVKTPTGDKNVVLSTFTNTIYKRFSEDSLDFKDAKIESFSDVKTGDQIRAIGEKNADGSVLKAEEIVTGGFKQIIGKITAINPQTNEITVQEFAEKQGKTTVVALKNTSLLRKFPEEYVQPTLMKMMGTASNNGATTVRPPNNSTPKPPQTTPSPTPTPNNGSVQIDENMFEKFQPVTLSELKIGDTIATLCPNKAGLSKFTAIRLLSGMEWLAAIPQITAMSGRGNGSPNLSIPGLDAFGTP